MRMSSCGVTSLSSARLCTVPLECLGHALRHAVCRTEAKLFASLVDGCAGESNATSAKVILLRRSKCHRPIIFGKGVTHCVKQLIQRDRLSAGNVICLTGSAAIVYRRGEDIRLNHIRDKTEIAGSLSVSEDPTPFTAKQAGDPARD